MGDPVKEPNATGLGVVRFRSWRLDRSPRGADGAHRLAAWW